MVVRLCGYVAMWHKVPSARVYLHVLSQAKSFSVDSMFADFVFFLLLVDANLKHPYFPHTLYELAINVTCDTTFRWLLRLLYRRFIEGFHADKTVHGDFLSLVLHLRSITHDKHQSKIIQFRKNVYSQVAISILHLFTQ